MDSSMKNFLIENETVLLKLKLFIRDLPICYFFSRIIELRANVWNPRTKYCDAFEINRYIRQNCVLPCAFIHISEQTGVVCDIPKNRKRSYVTNKTTATIWMEKCININIMSFIRDFIWMSEYSFVHLFAFVNADRARHLKMKNYVRDKRQKMCWPHS